MISPGPGTKIHEKCIICAREVEDSSGCLCNYCERRYNDRPYSDVLDPKAECSVCFRISSLFSCYFIGDNNDKSLHRPGRKWYEV